MKTRELIKALQEADPSGEAEVMTADGPIYYVESKPGYYDGGWSELIQDHSKDPYYNIVGYRFHKDGSHYVWLQSMDLDTVLLDNPEATVEFSGYSEKRLIDMELMVARMRKDAHRWHKDAVEARDRLRKNVIDRRQP